MSHIFISYSKQDIDFARYLRTLLEQAGLSVWLDEVRLNPSARWWKDIEKNIDTCAAFVVIMSPDAYESDWVEREILRAEKQKKPLYPVLLAGEPWSRLANIQFEDMRAGLHDQLSRSFLNGLKSHALPGQPRSITFHIVDGDILDYKADVVVLKHARTFYGADAAASARLAGTAGIDVEQLMVEPDTYRLVETQGALGSPYVLFVGTPRLRDFGYEGIRRFSRQALHALKVEIPDIRHIAMTIHGPGAGLDGSESLRAQFAGIMDAIQTHDHPKALERITIVEVRDRRAELLRALLADDLDNADYAQPVGEGEWGYVLSPPRPSQSDTLAGKNADIQPYACVIMSSDEALEDLFHFGIEGPTHAHGLLCVRLSPTGLNRERLESARDRIAHAQVVIVDMTEPDHMIYLQLGYALGKERPVIPLVRDARINHDLPLTEPLIYQSLKKLETDLRTRLRAL